ncbi:hypothetical protein [Nocardia sp. NPDC056000]|uniref:hypothetical protein n=1 Tax=Nocardia sp. NPDC056000 TaxID=3345674 RepID=UPI0035E0E224
MGMFIPADVPWDRPTVATIPIPPFATWDEHHGFLRMLQLYVALIDNDAPSFSTQVLNDVLTRSLPMHTEPRPLDPLVLQICMATYFPAPWTPATLADALTTAQPRLAPPQLSAPEMYASGAWRWGGDPVFSAEPRSAGGWEVERFERGNIETQVLTGYDNLVLWWMRDYSNRYPYPIGWGVDDHDARILAPAVAAMRRTNNTERWATWRESLTRDPRC